MTQIYIGGTINGQWEFNSDLESRLKDNGFDVAHSLRNDDMFGVNDKHFTNVKSALKRMEYDITMADAVVLHVQNTRNFVDQTSIIEATIAHQNDIPLVLVMVEHMHNLNPYLTEMAWVSVRYEGGIDAVNSWLCDFFGC